MIKPVVLGTFLFVFSLSLLYGQSPDRPYAPSGRPLPSTPRLVVKTNLLYDATSTFNLGVEIKTGRRLTLDVPFNYNPWTFSDNRKWKHWLVQPELRYWLCEPFYGHFLGVHTHYGQYNVGRLPFGGPLRRYRYEGWLTGAGVSYGYHLMLSGRWSVEGSLGLGYAYLRYDKYECRHCGEFLDRSRKHYFGVTKAAVSLIYVIR